MAYVLIYALAWYALWKIPHLRPSLNVRGTLFTLITMGLIFRTLKADQPPDEGWINAVIPGVILGVVASFVDEYVSGQLAIVGAARQKKRDEQKELMAAALKAEADARQREADTLEAARKRKEVDAEKVRLREERERLTGQQALHSHLSVVTGAMRAIRPGGDNAVLVTTMDEELKAIARNPKITESMIVAPSVLEEVELILQSLAQQGVDDVILLNRIRRVFQLDQSEQPESTPASSA